MNTTRRMIYCVFGYLRCESGNGIATPIYALMYFYRNFTNYLRMIYTPPCHHGYAQAHTHTHTYYTYMHISHQITASHLAFFSWIMSAKLQNIRIFLLTNKHERSAINILVYCMHKKERDKRVKVRECNFHDLFLLLLLRIHLLAQMPQRSYKFAIEIWNDVKFHKHAYCNKLLLITHCLQNKHTYAHILLFAYFFSPFAILWWSSSCAAVPLLLNLIS